MYRSSSRRQRPEVPGRSGAYSTAPGGKGLQGHSLRTRNYRLVRWVNKRGELGMAELYDHRQDPGENNNIAGRQPKIVAELSQELAAKIDQVVATSH